MNYRITRLATVAATFLALSCTLFNSMVYATDNVAPVLDSSRSPALSSVTEDPGAPTGAVGTLVSSLIDFASPVGQVDNVVDDDPGAVLGLAIVAVDTTNLTCYYSLNNGATWFTVGAVTNSATRLLAANGTNRIYCLPNANSNGTFTSALTFRAWDQTTGVDGSIGDASVTGGTTAFSTATDTVSLTVTAVNDAPSATNLSAAETYTEDTALNLVDIVASDVDNANLTVTLTLSNISAGSLSTGTSGAVTSTYIAGTGVWSASGATASVNTLLAGVTFTPASNFNSSFTVATSVSDGGLSVTGTKTFTGVAVNDAPSATNLSAAESYTEDTALNLVDIVASDADSATVIATLTLSVTSAGTLSTGTSGSVTSTYSAGTGVWTASGAIADVNTLLAGVTFTPASNFNSSFTITTSVSDGALSVTGSKTFTGTAVNDVPSATNLSAAESYTEDTALNLVDIVASDIDSANLTVTLTLSNAALGTLSTATSGAVTSTYVVGTGVWSAAGATASVNTLLAGVTFTPTANSSSSFTVATSVSDGFLSVTGSKSFTGTAANDAPTLDSSRTPTFSSVTEDAGAPSGVVGTSVSSLVDFTPPAGGLDNVADIDSGAVLGLAIVAVDTDHVSCFYSLDSGTTWSAVGAVTNSSARLLAVNGTNRIYCQPNANLNGTFSSALTFRAWDQSTGTSGSLGDALVTGGTTAFSTATDTVSLVVTAVNDAPSASDDSYPTSENTIPVLLDVLSNDSDVDGDMFSLVSVTDPDHGGTTEIVLGQIAYQPAVDFLGTETFDYVIEDPSETQSTGHVTITVLSTSKSIIEFTFPTSTASTIDEDAFTVHVTVPHNTNVTALVPTISITGASVSPLSGAAQDFTEPVVYTVTADDDSTQDYTVTVELSPATGGAASGHHHSSGGGSSSSTDSSVSSGTAETPYFTDIGGHWAEAYINELASRFGISGYKDEDGNPTHLFKPDNQLLRAELVEMVVKCRFPNLDAPNVKPFEDVDLDAWYAASVAKAKELGWIDGYSNGQFKPFAPISRAEALKVILLSQYSDGDIVSSAPSFADTPALQSGEEPWYYKYVGFALEQGFVSGYTNEDGEVTGLFGPQDFILRGQAAKMLVETIGSL